MADATEDVLDEILEERREQDVMWGPDHDDTHTMAEWFGLINERFFNPDKVPESATRRHFIEIAAISVAAVESIDRLAERDEAEPRLS